jgi:hypothetical protein
VLPNLLRHLSVSQEDAKFPPTSEARHFLFPTDYLYDNADEEQKNDLDIVREVLKVTKQVPIERPYNSLRKKSGQRADASGLETLKTGGPMNR